MNKKFKKINYASQFLIAVACLTPNLAKAIDEIPPKTEIIVKKIECSENKTVYVKKVLERGNSSYGFDEIQFFTNADETQMIASFRRPVSERAIDKDEDVIQENSKVIAVSLGSAVLFLPAEILGLKTFEIATNGLMKTEIGQKIYATLMEALKKTDFKNFVELAAAEPKNAARLALAVPAAGASIFLSNKYLGGENFDSSICESNFSPLSRLGFEPKPQPQY